MPETILDLDTRFRLLRALEQDPQVSQRALAESLGLSLGKTNYCVRSLVDRGWVKADGATGNGKKPRCLYCLTPAGVAEKSRIAHRFLERKIAEHRALAAEIEELRGELKVE